jgi:D-xylose transport system permease protein
VVIVVGYALVTLRRYQVQTRRKLQRPPFALVALKIAGLGAVVLTITGLLNQNRSPREGFVIEGIPWTLPVVAVLLVFWTFVLGRTAFGRHLYAVGGNAEAARRAGITVPRMKVAAFMICSTMAAVAGVLAAAYSGKVSPSSGGGNVLLYAVGAAVIGGTSLFGGRGRAVDAVIGGVVIAVIANGLGLLNQASYINYIVTGAVLLLAASVDAISRRRRSAAGI